MEGCSKDLISNLKHALDNDCNRRDSFSRVAETEIALFSSTVLLEKFNLGNYKGSLSYLHFKLLLNIGGVERFILRKT